MKYELIAIINPKSSNAQRVSKSISRLEGKLGKKVTSVQSDRDPVVFEKQFTKYITKNVTKKTVVLVGGGDGTVHHVVSATAKLPHTVRDNIILLPVWGGNANDFAYMLNGLALGKDLKRVISNGRAVKIHPLEIIMARKSVKTCNYAICYATFGASAYAADELDKSEIAREGLMSNVPIIVIVKELIRVVSAFVAAPHFKAKVNGRQVKIFEQVFTNGSRIAKIDRLPILLTDDAFYKIIQPSKHPKMIIRILKLMSGKKIGEITKKPVEFEVTEPILGQYDGEVLKIPKNTHVTVKLSDNYVYALSTKL